MAWFGSVDTVVFLLFFCSFFKARHCCTKSNCTSQNSFVRCHEEAQCLKLHWTQVYPYAYLNETDPTTPHGIVIEVAKTLLKRCCGTCWSIKKTTPVNFTDFRPTEPEDAGLTLPRMMSAVDSTYLQNYVPVIKDPTSAYVKKKEGWKILMKNLMSTLFGTWPVLVTALLFSWLSGMIIWFVEMWFNDEQFPRKFLRGSWEGFWWAFVSMTTVGYGDRAPRTFLGRLFAIFWIMIGICICSIFTATLTSALTMNVFDGQKTVTRQEVGVMEYSMEAITALQNQADLHYYNNSEDAWDAVLRDEVDGILLDYFYALAHEKELVADDLFIVNVFKAKGWSFGIDTISENLSKCMRSEYSNDYATILYEAIVSQHISEPTEVKTKGQISGIFDPNGHLFQTIMLFSAIGACLIFAIGVCWDCCCQGKKIICKPDKVTKFGKVEEELMSELHAVFLTWQERMEGTKGSFSLRKAESKA